MIESRKSKYNLCRLALTEIKLMNCVSTSATCSVLGHAMFSAVICAAFCCFHCEMEFHAANSEAIKTILV